MEGIDLAGVVDSDFQGILINFAPPRPAGFANFRRAGKTCFFAGQGEAALFRGAGRTSLTKIIIAVSKVIVNLINLYSFGPVQYAAQPHASSLPSLTKQMRKCLQREAFLLIRKF